MTDFDNVGSADPFADDFDQKESSNTKQLGDSIHIRVQQRNGRKCVTTVQGLPAKYDLKKILKELKKEFCCNGTVVEVDGESVGEEVKKSEKVITLQGDQRKNVVQFLTANKVANKDKIKIHGF